MGKPNPPVPQGTVPDAGYDKLDSTTPEQKHLLSPATSNHRPWASPSYDARTGRAAGFGYKGQSQEGEAEHGMRTNDHQSKAPTKPGRW